VIYELTSARVHTEGTFRGNHSALSENEVAWRTAIEGGDARGPVSGTANMGTMTDVQRSMRRRTAPAAGRRSRRLVVPATRRIGVLHDVTATTTSAREETTSRRSGLLHAKSE